MVKTTMRGIISVHVVVQVLLCMLTGLAQIGTALGKLTDTVAESTLVQSTSPDAEEVYVDQNSGIPYANSCPVGYFPCYKDCCQTGGWFCNRDQGEQRCWDCDTRRDLCGTDSLPIECLRYCYILQHEIGAEHTLCFSKETVIAVVASLVLSLLSAISAFALCCHFAKRRKSNEQPTKSNKSDPEATDNGGYLKPDDPASTSTDSLVSGTSSDTALPDVNELVDGRVDDVTEPLIPCRPPEGPANPDDPACPGAVTPEGPSATRASGVQLEQPPGGTVPCSGRPAPSADHGETARFLPSEGADVSGNSNSKHICFSSISASGGSNQKVVLAVDTANPVPGRGQNT